MIESMQTTAVLVRERLAELLAAIPHIAGDIGNLLATTSATGSTGWHLMQIFFGLVFAAAGYLVKRYVELWGRKQFEYMFNPVPVDRAEKIAYLLTRTLLQLFALGIMFAVAALLAIIFQNGAVQRADFLLPVSIATLTLLGSTIFRNLLASDVPSHRLLVVGDADAQRLCRVMTIVFGIGFGIVQLINWLSALGMDRDADTLFQILGTLAAAILLSGIAVIFRREVAVMVCGGNTRASKGVRFVTNVWHVVAVAYCLGAWSVSAVRYLLELPAANGLAGGPLIALMIALLVYAVLLLIVDSIANRHGDSETNSKPGDTADAAGIGLLELAERGAAVLAWAVAIFYLFWVWGIDISADGILVNAVDVLLVLFAGWFTYRVISVLVNRKIEREGGVAASAPGQEGGGQGGTTRIAMLLSLFRKFLLVTVVTIVGMIVLSELGVDVAPLFAGAGVVGLAVGFGAQTLVRDVFSGAFFLMDDAFRVGEYIDVGSVKGTVEKISIRSMQLRHHMGPLHTIPFGEITHLTNYARDWVMMKLKLRVTYDTDIERVRKLVKKLGQDLLEHPNVGKKFMEPLKSQGVYSMEDDNAIIIRVKFMTKPGEQFDTRKVVYQAIRDLFEREGIKFATKREVVVRVADAEEKSEPSAAVMGAAATAALTAADAMKPKT